jgi:hypothetical protein
MTSYSIAVRLQRVTVEECHVSVPVTDAVLRPEPDENGERFLDPEKVFAAALALGAEQADWRAEEQSMTLHPVQQAPDGADQQ